VSTPALRIAVVGHTNTGKTSLVRTLTHDRRFGEVRDQGGTTRRIRSGSLVAAGGERIELFDSPGLENAPELLDWLEDMEGERHDRAERIHRLIGDERARKRFDHEVRVLGLVLEVDVALYVIDAREPVLEKYQDELDVLGWCARPIIAVLNFTAAPGSREAEWREALAQLRLHTVLAFDAAIRDPATEMRLFEKLRSLLDHHALVLDAWLAHRRDEEAKRRRSALQAVAELLLDAAALVREVPAGDEAGRQRSRQAMREAIGRREQACIDTLLELYRFGRDDFDDSELPISDGRWQADLFDPETLRHFGLSTSGHAAVGAGAGAAIDIGTGGLSLGAGTLAGAALGAGAGLLRSAGARWVDRARGRERLQVDDAVLRLLMARALELLDALLRRGHGSPARIRTGLGRRIDRQRLPRALRRARYRPGWSSLNAAGSRSGRDAARAALVGDLARLQVEGGRQTAEELSPD